MMIELRKTGVPTEAQSAVRVLYGDEIIGEYYANIIVDNKP